MKERKWIGRKGEVGEQKGRRKGGEQEGRSKENELGERERKVSKKQGAKEMDWEKGRGW